MCVELTIEYVQGNVKGQDEDESYDHIPNSTLHIGQNNRIKT